MEIVTSLVGPVVQSLMVPLKQHLGYLISSTKHVRNMCTKMKILDCKSIDIKNHTIANEINNLEVPARVPGWLEEVENIKGHVERISGNDNGCFNMRKRYLAGRNASKITEDIEQLFKENQEIIWVDTLKLIGRVKKVRDEIFEDALKFLQQDHKTQVIALCGMGGVGKTMMMEQLKKVAEDKEMFDWIVKVVIGQSTNLFSIQNAIADYIGEPLTEMTETAMTDRLSIRFEEMSQQGKRKILVILDDVCEMVSLKDIGLSSLPNGLKLLLTSREEGICTQIAVEANTTIKVVKVDVLEEGEAHNFFCRIAEVSEEHDPDLYLIGGDIVRRCGFLPLAIQLIASTLKYEDKVVWKNTLHHLEAHDLDIVHEAVKISYNYLKEEEDKAIFMLCGLFPNGSNIPVEDLTRYAWGLELLHKVPTLGDARNKTITCVHNLKKANLLIDSEYVGCVKMHDLVLDFVLGSVSKGNHPWIINHGDMSKWDGAKMSKSCKRISLTCIGMSEFPRDFKCPNLSLLKLMHGDKLLRFPQDFYGNMKKLEVIAYEKMQCPLLPAPFHFPTNLRTLCLKHCLLIDDLSFVGNLVNLEVLSFAHCYIRKLPSIIGNLKKLKLLDLTGCVDLCIADGVLKSLVDLEELYMRCADQNAINFTYDNCNELVEHSHKLSTLEIEFFENNAQPKNMSLKQLERFKISMGCFLDKEEEEDDNLNESMHSFENTLMLITTTGELLESRMSELFEKTKVLYLEVDDMKELEDVLAKPLSPPQNPFYNLKVLHVYKCAHLSYLFTVHVARGLTKLERLIVSGCLVMRELVYSENGESEVIKFQELKFLHLAGLPKLVSLCSTTIEMLQLVELRLDGLPNFTSIYPENKSTSSMSSNIFAVEPLLNKKVVSPKLEILNIKRMENLKEIWPCQITSEEGNISMLREIKVKQCDSLVNLFPNNPMSLLHRLENLEVEKCGSIEVLFNIDLGCVGEIREDSSRLRKVIVDESGKLREVWRIKGVKNYDLFIRGFQDVEEILIDGCESFRNVFTPTTINFDMGALRCIHIGYEERRNRRNNELVGSRQEINVISKKQEISEEVDDIIPDVAFPSHLMHTFHHLQTLSRHGGDRVEVVFDMESASNRELATTRNNQLLLLSNLKELDLKYMMRMSHVWKCNWNKFLVSQKQVLESSFHNLTNIQLMFCPKINYLFSPLMAKLLSNLKKVYIWECNGFEEVVSNRDDENEEITTSASTHTSTALFPHLDALSLSWLPNLERIGGDGAKGGRNEITFNNTTSIYDPIQCSLVGVASWSFCQYSRKIEIKSCHALSSVIPFHAIGRLQKLEELEISRCKSMMEVFEIEGVNNGDGHNTNADDGMTFPRLTNTSLLELFNLKILKIDHCRLLEHIFIFSTLESLMQLKELSIKNCKAMQVIVKEENEEHTTSSKVVDFPRLESLELVNLPNLKGFFLGMNDFQWPLLDKVKIGDCPQIMVFTSGESTTPKLNYIHTSLGKYSLERGLNFPVATTLFQAFPTPFSSLDDTSLCPTSEGMPWPFSNLIEIDMEWISNVKKIIPSNELLQLQKLEKIDVMSCDDIEEIFEVLEGTNNCFTESQSVVKLPKLRDVKLRWLHSLKYIWKSNQWTTLEFPNLTRVSIVRCKDLEHVFTCSMVGSLSQLQELDISHCTSMEVIVEDANVVPEKEESGAKPNEITLPCLKSLMLRSLPSFKGFCLGNGAFSFPSLDTLGIMMCPKITVFTNGQSATPKLNAMRTRFGMCYVRDDLNSCIKTGQQEGRLS